MSEQKHTPTPWVIDEEVVNRPTSVSSSNALKNAEYVVAQLWGPDAKANAELIVRVVNCHDELVEALKEARNHHVNESETNFLAKIDAALAKASGEDRS